MKEFYTVKKNTSVEITEKKSKFIANLFGVQSKEEAEDIIKDIKKKYHDARHNCIAYRVLEDDNIIEKSSDDGEPSGTAGAPMLDLLKNNNLCNVLVVVTRYFGGILLGTGGLVRAYTESTKKAIDKAEKICKCEGYEIEIELDYNSMEIFKYYCNKNNISISKVEYSNIINCKIELPNEMKQKFLDDIVTKKIKINNTGKLCKKSIDKV